MPQIKSAIKRVKTAQKAQALNASQKSAMRTAIKKFEAASEANADNKQALYTEAISKIDWAHSKGLIHANTAARNKSRLTHLMNK
ncbi:30S ribosomal protein S20 [Schleiferilactobacillus shenzhenensis]|uniref:Small ribosomal subunit protein bS20 n=1 Tax=Schleiferilactobacillus shenzhenensis LY-73 TaxID=1231336 RepID=U4TNQ6_9LACO|nr:30S ribosomal protein S20 [Schleiferilactobacillus shenzhenensis]ERL66521.1 RpsT [Schleiferilactobacillus shenzhenensis LY-73]